MMKKRIVGILFLFLAIGVYAQNESGTDSIVFPAANYKQHGGFLLDMGLLTLPQLPKLDFSYNSFLNTEYSIKPAVFRLNPGWTVNRGNLPAYSSFYSPFFGQYNDVMSSSFQLNDNIRLNTYGQYTIDGKKIPNTNPNPWNRNDFMGGFELKFNNNFGIRVDVRSGYNPYYPY